MVSSPISQGDSVRGSGSATEQGSVRRAGLSAGGDTALLTGTCVWGCGGVWVTFLEHSKHFRDQTISSLRFPSYRLPL